jgi:hypothetical protein
VTASAGPRVVTVNELLDGHVVLDIECLDLWGLEARFGVSVRNQAAT